MESNNTNTHIVDIDPDIDLLPLPPPPLLRRVNHNPYDFDRLAQMPDNHINNKVNIVKKSLLNTYEFVNKLKSDKKNECKIDFILVTFNDAAQIFSTVKLPNLTSTDISNYELIRSVHEYNFSDMKQIIEENLIW